MTDLERNPERLFAAPAVELERRRDGTLLLRCAQPLGRYARCVGEFLERWGRTAPDRPFLLERARNGAWSGVTYAEALQTVRSVAAALLRRGLGVERPVAILS